MAKSFRDLVAWQRSMELAVAVYRLTKDFPREELYGLSNQMRRAAVSLPSNIAEGHGRLTTGEFRQFLGVARASNFELQTQLELAQRLDMANVTLVREAENLSHEIGRMLYAILESTKTRRARADL